MSFLFCVDPGLRGCGVALFRDKALARAGYVKNPITMGRHYRVYTAMGQVVCKWLEYEPHNVIIELPRIYPHADQQKGDPNDLLDVACVGSAISAMLNGAETVFPSEWKGQVPKEVMTERIKKALTKEEMSRVELVGAKDHNTFDAVGIGLHALGRLGAKKVFY